MREGLAPLGFGLFFHRLVRSGPPFGAGIGSVRAVVRLVSGESSKLVLPGLHRY